MSPPSSGGASPGAVGGGGTTGAVPGGTGALGGLLGGTTGGGGYLAGGSPGGAVDAGAPPLVDAGSADSGAEVEAGIDDADAGPSDGGVEAGPAADAGLCPTESPARVDGGCQGSYCNLTVDGLAALALPAGACSGEATLQLVCDAQLAHKTAQCAQENVLSLSLDSAVRSCLRRDPQLAQVAGACVDCYVAELICTLSNCLATCVAGFDVACTSCRREHCGQEFTRCSGLPSL